MALFLPSAPRFVAYLRVSTDKQGRSGFGMAQRQAEHGSRRQRHRDRQARISCLPASYGARLGLAGRDRLLGESHRQAAALA